RLSGAAAHPGAGDAQLHQPTRLHVSRAGELCDPLSRVLRDRAPRDADDARGHGRRGSPPMSAAPVPEGVRGGGVLRAALAYLVTGFATFLLMGLLGLHMRLDQGGLMTVSPTWFYRIMTLHGSGMVAGTMLATMGGLAAAVERTVRLSARALWTAFLVYMLGMGFIVLATTLGGFAAGWTVLYPLPALERVLEKNLAYLFGHQLANLNIYFAAAFVYALVAEHTGRPWPASRHVAVAWNLVLLLVLLPWPHHLYQDFAQPAFMPIAAEAVSFLVGIPSFLVTIFGALGRIHRSGMRWSV